MTRRKAVPKLTQEKIITLMIEITANELCSHYRFSRTEFIPSKNLDTLEKMAKRGILDRVPYSANGFTFSADSMVKYSDAIRQSAIREATTHWNYQWMYASTELNNAISWYQFKFLAHNKKIEHSTFNNPDFCVLDYTGWIVDSLGEDKRISPKPYPHISDPDDRCHQLTRTIEHAEILTRAEIGAIPTIEIVAY